MTDREDTNIWPGLHYDDPLAARAWLAALGFTEGICVPGETEGSVMHSEMLWPEGGRVMVHGDCGTEKQLQTPTGTGSCYVVTASPEEVHARARSLDATFVRELEETDYGSKGFTLTDAEGNLWSFGTYDGRES